MTLKGLKESDFFKSDICASFSQFRNRMFEHCDVKGITVTLTLCPASVAINAISEKQIKTDKKKL